MLLCVYVDDFLIMGPDEDQIVSQKTVIVEKFHITDLGPCKFYLGLYVDRDINGDVYLH